MRAPRTVVVPADETKEAKSTRLAAARMTATLEKLALIGNLNGSAYSLTETQVNVMEKTLTAAVAETVAKLRKQHNSGFAFPADAVEDEAVETVVNSEAA